MFWNFDAWADALVLITWTLNMKCFEIITEMLEYKDELMNLKHEMFWNYWLPPLPNISFPMNLKHEMFWNFWESLVRINVFLMNLKHEMFYK